MHNNVVDESVNIPAIDDLSDEELENIINHEIQKRISITLEEAEIRAAEYKQAYLETGGSEEEYIPIEITVDYEIKCQDANILSFVLYQYESLASAYAEYQYYNLDVVENKIITLEDILGIDYKKVINESIYQQIEKLEKEGTMTFFKDDMGFMGIREDQSFYINKDSKVVVVFNKYEIAPGAMGRVEFIIE